MSRRRSTTTHGGGGAPALAGWLQVFVQYSAHLKAPKLVTYAVPVCEPHRVREEVSCTYVRVYTACTLRKGNGQ
jgi:hypothetical protein